MAIYTGRPHSGSAASVLERPANLASDKQVAFAWKLIGEREGMYYTQDELAAMTKRSISTVIDRLLTLPKKAAVLAQEVGPGFYRLDGEFYKVNKSKSSGYLYALRWDGSGWDYDGGKGVYRKLTADMALSAEDAKAFGDQYHACVFCIRELTDQRSVDAGYGPICASKYNLPWG